MSYHLPERKTEQAFKAYFGAITGLEVRTRFSGAEKSLPELVIMCPSCEPSETIEVSGAILPAEWSCGMRFVIRSRYIKGDQAEGEAHDTFVGAVSDMIADATIIAGLNQFSAMFDFQAVRWEVGARENRINDKDLETELNGTLWMVPSAT